jgi:serine/threonine protein kinase/CRP-like cAMP-binding protein
MDIVEHPEAFPVLARALKVCNTRSSGMTEFSGTDRFQLVRRLGAGGMGIVYEAFDRERGEHVALKTLSRVDPAGIYDLKKEFRSLADVRHPNVVSLYDIVNEAEHWFFTMELVYGTTFSDYVAAAALGRDGAPSTPRRHGSDDGRQPAKGDDAALLASQTRADARTSASLLFEEAKLRSALGQLVLGVSAIHAAGKLHRDLKPSNVLITGEGRVVVLDFGLVQDDSRSSETADTSLDDNLVVGTPGYMAPEQAAGKRATPATDWYAVGTMLYRALSGRLPFTGSLTDVLLRKQTEDAPLLSGLVHGVPKDLERLTMDLLRRRPEARLGEVDLRQRLELDRAPPRASVRPESAPFLGRDAELASLESALALSRRGLPQVVFLEGPSGLGKSALVQHFLRGVRQTPSAVVLSGRCYPREALPYKAFDAIIDALSRFLGRLPEASAAELLPRNRRALTSLFPVLERVPIIDAWDSLARLPSAPVERRERAFAALKELLGRVSDQGPLVLTIDNLEWGDKDSAELLMRLCSAPDPPAMLVIGTHRPEPERTNAFFERLGAPNVPLGEAARQDRSIGPLAPQSAFELCKATLNCEDALCWRIAEETAGDPLLISLLCEHIRERLAADDRAPRPQLEALVDIQLGTASHEARQLLELVAVAGAPLTVDAAAAALGLGSEQARACISELRGSILLQLVHHRGREALSIRHERIALVLASRLSEADTAASHARLAAALAARDEATPETLADHYQKAGALDDARRYATLAARDAERSLAFERAAQLYERALGLTLESGLRTQLLEQLADARLHSGQPGSAAQALLDAAMESPPERAVELRRRASALRLTDEQLDALFVGSGSAEGLFDGITREEAQAFLARGQIIEASRGACVSRRSDGPAPVLVVLAGGLSVEQVGGKVNIGPGEILGTLSFLQNTARLADVNASEDGTRVLSITRASLDELSQRQPQLALQLTVNLARILCGKLVNVHARAFGS